MKNWIIMPRGFHPEEREHIRQKILKVGTDFFRKFGIRKTSIEEITKACGIAKGTFYLFFPSKERLFLEIFTAESRQMHESLYQKLLSSTALPKEKLKTFLRDQYHAIDNSPSFNIIFNKEEVEYLIRKCPEALPALTANLDEQQYLPFIEEMKKLSILKDVDSLLAVGELKLVFLLFTHKREYSPELYDRVFEKLLELITTDLVK
jgi:AcrR family transcriptional regulator